MVATAAPKTPVIDRPACLTAATIPRRKLRALAVIGYDPPLLAECTGQDAGELTDVRDRDDLEQIPAELAVAIGRAYDVLHACPRAERVSARARLAAAGWAGPDEWIDIDDPHELPDRAYRLADVVVADRDAAGGRDTVLTVDQIDEIRDAYRMTDPGRWDRSAVAKRYGVRPDAIGRAVNGRGAPGYTDLRPWCGRRHVAPPKPAKPRNGPRVSADTVRELRDAYTAARAGTWRPGEVAKRYGIRRDALAGIIRGRLYGPADDLVARHGDKTRGHTPPAELTTAQIHAVRADYLAGLGKVRLAAKHGISKTCAWQLIHGAIRPELGLTDLTVQQGGHTPAATPTGRENRKGTAA